jgi:hypothetical protein
LADAPAVVATKGVRPRWHAYASGTAPTVWLPINHRGPQEPDQAPQAVFKAQVARAQGQQQAAQLMQLPALLALGGASSACSRASSIASKAAYTVCSSTRP